MIYNDVELYNVEDLIKCDDGYGFRLSRVPRNIYLNLNEQAKEAAFNGCGVEIRFNMISDEVKIILGRQDSVMCLIQELLKFTMEHFRLHIGFLYLV